MSLWMHTQRSAPHSLVVREDVCQVGPLQEVVDPAVPNPIPIDSDRKTNPEHIRIGAPGIQGENPAA